MKVKLGVNIDHVATLRQQRREGFPDPTQAALIAQAHGADSIVAHLREDRRHIQDADLYQLKKKLRIPLAMEMAATDEMVRIACRVRPQRVCLVPEKRQELTTEGGLDVARQKTRLQKKIQRLQRHGILVSLFIDPDVKQVAASQALQAEIIELHTGAYATAKGSHRRRELVKLKIAAAYARSLGLALHAGHGLDYENIGPIAALPDMEELNIGFSIIARSVFDGLAPSIRRMIRCIRAADL